MAGAHSRFVENNLGSFSPVSVKDFPGYWSVEETVGVLG
jgi:hypothetical protein